MQNNIINGVIYKKSLNKTRNTENNLRLRATNESGPFVWLFSHYGQAAINKILD